MQSKILLDIFTKLDHSRLHPGVFLHLVVTVLKSKGDDSKENASKDDNEDTAQVVKGSVSSSDRSSTNSLILGFVLSVLIFFGRIRTYASGEFSS